MMNQRQENTWHNLQTYQFPSSHQALSFKDRLARENAWSKRFTERVIDEYLKFCFLARHAGHPVTPSDQVDQVWHLHLLYSQDYWEVFCPQVLGQSLHHGPTAGGPDEQAKYRCWYEHTRQSYQRYFGPPPTAIWPDSETRFTAAKQMVRINTADTVLLDRRKLRWGLQLTALAGLGLGLGTASAEVEDLMTGLGIAAVIGLALGLLVAMVAIAKSIKSAKNSTSTGCGGAGGTAGGKADSGSHGADGGCGGGCGGCGGG